jgi:hypothetical protein
MKTVNEYIAAGDLRISQPCVQKLARSRSYEVRRRLAENASTPYEVLVDLLHDSHGDVRLGLSFNPIVQRPFLEELVRDDDVDVRFGLAENTTLPVDLLEVLSRDDNPYVSSRAKQTIEIVLPIVEQILPSYSVAA